MTLAQKPVNFMEKFDLFDETWTPKIVAEMNDYQFKIARFEDDFIWHKHNHTDEAFIVLEGRLRIEMRDKHVYVDAGSMYVVPKGVEHKPCAETPCKILLIEPRGVINTGDLKNNLTVTDLKYV